MTLFDDVAKDARDAAINAVSEASAPWMDQAVAVFPALRLDAEFIGEDIRHEVVRRIGPAHHHNAYGALVSQLLKAKLIVPTGRFSHMRDLKSHARLTRVYRKA